MKVHAQSLSKSYPTPSDPLVVLDDISLELDAGEALAITGPSGSGKSTLLHILGTLDEPTAGTVTFDGQNPFELDDTSLSAFRNLSLGFVFQDHYLLPQLSVLENVLVPTIAGKSGSAEITERARDLLSRVGLAERVGHRPSELSGGERQRAAIARALIQRPGFLLCDEPTGNLDAQNADRAGELLLELPESEGCTLVVVTHSEELASRFPKRLSLRAGGQVGGSDSGGGSE